MFVLQEINPNVKNVKDMAFSLISRRANQITKELSQVMNITIWNIHSIDLISMGTLRSLFNTIWSQGAKKPYQQVIDVSSGDPHAAGVKPLSFVRQVT